MQVANDGSAAGVLSLEGVLSIDGAEELKELLTQYLKVNDSATVNLARVAECDTVALQLLVSAQKTANAESKNLSFKEVPADLRTFSSALGLDLFENDSAGDDDGHA